MLPHVLAWCDGYTWLYMVRHAHCLEDYPTCPWFGYVPIGLSHFKMAYRMGPQSSSRSVALFLWLNSLVYGRYKSWGLIHGLTSVHITGGAPSCFNPVILTTY